MSERPNLTTSGGNPIGDNQNSLTAGDRGPILMQDYQLLEKLTHQNREGIPEKVVHAKGSGACCPTEIPKSPFSGCRQTDWTG